jgi:transcription elongation factor GreA-like protein
MAKAKTIKKGDVKTVETPAPKKRDKVNSETRREYSAAEVYEEGECIYHKTWDDVGEILEVGITEDGIKKIRVQFEKVGLKTLCMGR